MISSVVNKRSYSGLDAPSPSRSAPQMDYLKRRIQAITLLASVLGLAPLTYIAPADALEAAGKATVRCSAFSGDPRRFPAWVSSPPYSISGDKLLFGSAALFGKPSKNGEVNEWHGSIDASGQILLTGEGSGGGGAWVMHFTGPWRGAGSTRLEGGYKNVQGLVGGRTCSIVL